MKTRELWYAPPGTKVDAKILTDMGLRGNDTGHWAPATVVALGVSANGGSTLIVSVMTWDFLEEEAAPVLHTLPGTYMVREPELPRGPADYEPCRP